MSASDGRLARNTALTVLALVALRLVAAAWTPLTFDEAYYWMWSKHLAFGYYDHPPAVAFVIRAWVKDAALRRAERELVKAPEPEPQPERSAA